MSNVEGGKRKKKGSRKNLAGSIGAMRMTIPDEVMQFYLNGYGINTLDTRVGRLMALSIEKKLVAVTKMMSDSKAEQHAAESEHGDATENNGGKRTKSEQVDHKHPHPEGDTRKIVSMAMNCEENSKDQPK